MGVFPRVILRWREPRVLRATGFREERRSLTRLVSLSLLAALPVLWMTHRLSPDATGRVIIALALLIGFMLFTFLIYRVFPSWVELTDTAINQSVTTDDQQAWRFDAIRQCEIAPRRIGGQRVRVLIIETRKGDRFSIGIAESIATEQLKSALRSKGVKIVETDERLIR